MQLPKRKQIRLKHYNYSQNGYYFVTVCTKNRYNLLTETTKLIVEQKLNQIPRYYPAALIDYYVVMQNHIHVIIVIDSDVRARGPRPYSNDNVGAGFPRPSIIPTLGQIIAYFKYQSTKSINALSNTASAQFWQRGYYEHIIRNESSLHKIREYIMNNPEKLKYDWDKLDIALV